MSQTKLDEVDKVISVVGIEVASEQDQVIVIPHTHNIAEEEECLFFEVEVAMDEELP